MGDSRSDVLKLLKARGFKARRGHLRCAVGDLFWYVDLRLDGLGPRAGLALEVGCWTPQLPPEPDGGAVDCPMLIDVPLGDPVTETGALIDHVMEIGDLATLRERRGEFPGALMDRTLRELLGV